MESSPQFVGAVIGAISALFTALGTVAKLYMDEVKRDRDRCVAERDAHRKANEEALQAFRRREAEDEAWRRERERDTERDRLRAGAAR